MIETNKQSLKLLIDYGGTHFRYVIKSEDKVIDESSIDTKNLDLIDFLTSLLSKKTDIDFVGIGVAAQVKNGVILSAPNINIKDRNLKKYIEDRFDVQVEVDNDLKVAALAEMDLEGDDKSIVLLYIGTGFGSAFIEKGTIIRGESNLAGEIGHIPFKKAPFLCGCGKDNCVELFASGIGLQKWIEYYGICVGEPTLEALENLQDTKAKEILENFYKALLHAVSTIVTLLNPNSLILGGAVFKNNPTLVDFLKDNLNLEAFKPSLKELEIKLSTLSSANLKGVDILIKQKRKT